MGAVLREKEGGGAKKLRELARFLRGGGLRDYELAELIAQGIIPEEERASHLPPRVLPGNEEAVRLFTLLRDQYRILGYEKEGRPVIAPDIPAIKAMLDIYEVKRKEEVFEKILFLFHEVLLGD